MEYYGNDDFMFAWDLGVIFLSVLNCAIGGFSNNFLGLKGVMEKCVGCFLVYLFLRVLFCFKKVLRDRKFKFLCETYPPVSCNTHYSVSTVSFMWGCLELKYSKKDTISWNVLKTTKIS